MPGRVLKIGVGIVVLLVIAAAIFGAGLGIDFSDGYLIRISSAQPFDFESVSHRIYEEFSGKLGEVRIQHGTENYNDQLVIRVQYAEQADAERMTAIAAEDCQGAYLRSFDAMTNAYGSRQFWKITAWLLIAWAVSGLYFWYRQGLSGGLAAWCGGLGAMLCSVSLTGIAGIALSEGTYLAAGLPALAIGLLSVYLLEDGAGAKASLLAGEHVEEIFRKSRQNSGGRVLIALAAVVFFALAGCVLAGAVLRGYMVAVLLSAIGAGVGSLCIGLPVYLLHARKYMLKAGTKRKAKAIK